MSFNLLDNLALWGGGWTGWVIPFLFGLSIVVFFHELGDPIRADPVLNQITNFIEGEHLPRLSEPWQVANTQEKYRQNDTPPYRTNCLQKININFQAVLRDGILRRFWRS